MRKRKIAYFIFVILLNFYATTSFAQLDKLTNELFNTTEVQEAPLHSPIDSARLADSIKFAELQEQVQQMKLNEILLLEELEYSKKSSAISDSMKIARRKERIDSLRTHTSGSPVIISSDTLFILYAKQGGISLFDRANYIQNAIIELGETRSIKADSTKLISTEEVTEMINGGKIILSVSENDALWMNIPRDSLANMYRSIVVEKIKHIQKQHSLLQLAKRILYFLLIIIAQYILFRITNYLFKKLRRVIIRFSKTKFKSVSIKGYDFLNTSRLAHIMVFFANILRYALIFLQLIFSVPMLFSIFPQTEYLANHIFSYIVTPIKQVATSVLHYIPNVFFIIIIWLCTRYLLKGIKYLANEMENERLTINGFYPDLAQPTYNIVRFLLYAFMIAMMWPYLPGSDSQIFQGISVFVGLIISLGSSTVIGNIMAGLVITYMRPFKIGDRIKLNDTVGNVIEKTPFVTRIKTPKNEIITIPNSFIMSSHTVNYTASARNHGLIIHTSITIGYEVDWRIVHQLLIEAAKETKGVSDEFKPFVLDTGLGDYYPIYQINAFIRDADQMAGIYARLHQNIQDKFKQANIDIASPIMHVERENGEAMLEKDFLEQHNRKQHPKTTDDITNKATS